MANSFCDLFKLILAHLERLIVTHHYTRFACQSVEHVIITYFLCPVVNMSCVPLIEIFGVSSIAGFEVKVLPSVSIEKLGCKTRRKSGHCQLYIPDIYKYFQSHWPRDAFCVVGITMSDLYPSESFQFVFGEANYSEGIGVFSFARYDPLFYTERSKSCSKTSSMSCISPVVLWRSCKVRFEIIAFLLFFIVVCSF